MIKKSLASPSSQSTRSRGFTLIELMIVVVVLAILTAIAYPSYQRYVRDARRAEAQADLTGFSAVMERWFSNNNTYQGAANGGADTGAPAAAVYGATSPVGGGTPAYNLTIQAANATSFTLRATPVGPQVGDGLMDLTSTGLQLWDRNNDGDTGDANENHWKKH